jgi:hypothetical protein
MPIDPGSRVVRSAEPVLAAFSDGFVMLSVEAQKYFSLNDTAEAIWRRMAQPITLQALSQSLAEEFDVAPDLAASAVAAFVSRLVEEGVASMQAERGS